MSAHKTEELKGRAKEATGDLTGDKDLQREGKVDQASAESKQTMDKAADGVKGLIKPKK